jgi:hypothetical protein
VKLADLKPGDRLRVTTDEFLCLSPGRIVHVEGDDLGRLFVPCAEGKHYISPDPGVGGPHLAADGETVIGLAEERTVQ